MAELDEHEQRIAAAGLPGLAALSATLRDLDGKHVKVGKDSDDRKARRARSRMFLYTGSQR